jgi:hypothetical protein
MDQGKCLLVSHYLLTIKTKNIMKRKQFKFLIGCFTLFILGCNTDGLEFQEMSQSELNPELNNNQANAGATQISGVGFFATECDLEGQGADFALLLTGDLEGCLYVFVDNFDCSPSGTYREEGRELFVGTYNGVSGSFWTNYKFRGKYEGCSEEGFFLGAEIFGRCQHPIENGSGDGVFAGVKGRLDFKDDIETGEFPYRGHLKY